MDKNKSGQKLQAAAAPRSKSPFESEPASKKAMVQLSQTNGSESNENAVSDESNIRIKVELPATNDIGAIPKKVMATILNLLSTAELGACRLVSKKWNRQASAILNAQKAVKVKSKEDIEKFLKVFSSAQEGISLKPDQLQICGDLFLETIVENNRGGGSWISLGMGIQNLGVMTCPYVKTLVIELSGELVAWLMLPSTRKEVCEIFRFILVRFKGVECLELEYNFLNSSTSRKSATRDREVERVEDEHQLVKYELPKLKTLKISHKPQSIFRAELRALTGVWKSVLQSAVNLRTLSCWGQYGSEVVNELRLISPELVTLCFSKYVGPLNLEALANHHFPKLAHFWSSATIDWNQDNDEVVQRFFEKYSTALTELKLNISDFELVFPSRGAVMEKLEKLELCKFPGTVLWQNIPNLRELIIAKDIKYSPSVLPIGWVHNDFTQRICRLQEQVRNPSLKSPAIQLWPSSLAQLHLEFRSELDMPIFFGRILPQLFCDCTQLKILTVKTKNTVKNLLVPELNDPIFMDQCLTGLSKGTLEKGMSECQLRFNDTDEGGMTLIERSARMIEAAKALQLDTVPNIGNLSDLQELHLEGLFSDAALLFGVLNCCKLRKLTLKSQKLTKNAKHIAKCGLPNSANVFDFGWCS